MQLFGRLRGGCGARRVRGCGAVADGRPRPRRGPVAGGHRAARVAAVGAPVLMVGCWRRAVVPCRSTAWAGWRWCGDIISGRGDDGGGGGSGCRPADWCICVCSAAAAGAHLWVSPLVWQATLARRCFGGRRGRQRLSAAGRRHACVRPCTSLTAAAMLQRPRGVSWPCRGTSPYHARHASGGRS